LPIVVFDVSRPGNIRRVVLGERMGTFVGPEDSAGVGTPAN
jgi:uridylate kinase